MRRYWCMNFGATVVSVVSKLSATLSGLELGVSGPSVDDVTRATGVVVGTAGAVAGIDTDAAVAAGGADRAPITRDADDATADRAP